MCRRILLIPTLLPKLAETLTSEIYKMRAHTQACLQACLLVQCIDQAISASFHNPLSHMCTKDTIQFMLPVVV